ncbi:N(4)-acetylcytidine aminohydrolase [Shewanella sp. KJ2020]|uniref:N(4)-acetylcytidine aminohydrolase n=1 Tax=Shewanella sp. KJ2020 TaxID=2919172 RepID=UPI0020A782F2|nr:N(4)-acetylcytidine aminohydrolase [Shewanella sp. KJ2020]MCP3126856.1 N(4)-acetylcytidine aminohydrolase [Shewanella sp. KJ2020]
MKNTWGRRGQLLTKITFFERFERDILSGAKTITLRDEAESYVTVGQVLPVSTFESDRWFCDIQILEVTPLALSDLNQTHAEQENMTLAQLRLVIAEIYPGVEQLFMLRFNVLNPVGKSNTIAP